VDYVGGVRRPVAYFWAAPALLKIDGRWGYVLPRAMDAARGPSERETDAGHYRHLEPQTWYIFARLHRLEEMLKRTVALDKNGDIARTFELHAQVSALLEYAECIVRTADAA